MNDKTPLMTRRTKNNYKFDRTKGNINIKNPRNLTILQNNSTISSRISITSKPEEIYTNYNIGTSANSNSVSSGMWDILHRNPRHTSSQKVFHNISDGFFQSSASIQFLQPFDDESGLYSPDYSDSTLFNGFPTEMSDKEFESLGFPVSPKPTHLFDISANDHNFGLIGSNYDTDTGGFSGIEIISRECIFCRKCNEILQKHI